jgi:hypothetical protein
VNAIINIRVPLEVEKLSSGYATGGLSSSAQLRRVRSFVSGNLLPGNRNLLPRNNFLETYVFILKRKTHD